MRRGGILWLRHNRVPQALLASAIGALAVRASLLVITSDGGGVDISPLWLATVMALPLLFTFSYEDSLDRAAPRSLPWRRAGLFALTLGTTALGSWLLTPVYAEGLGAVATWRNCLALLGLGLLGLYLAGATAMWLVPLTVSLASMLFAWPLRPGILHGVLGFLRAPAGLHFPTGGWNLSIPVSLVLATAGFLAHTTGTFGTARGRSPFPDLGSARSAYGDDNGDDGSTLSHGLKRVSRYRLVVLIAGSVCAWTLLSSLGKWGGSPRLLLGNELPSGAFIHAPLGALIGVVMGQTRWRTGTAVWQQLSGRSQLSLLARECRGAITATILALGIPIVALALLSTVTLAAQSGNTVASRELAGGAFTALLVFIEAGLLCVVGTLAGWFIRGVWVPPLVLVLALAAMIPAPRIPTQDVDRIWEAKYPTTECSRVPALDVTVCTTPPLSGYLPAAVQSVSDIYQAAPRREVLPRRILLTDRGPMGVSAPHSMAPTVSVRRAHGLRPPPDLGPTAAESLTYSTQAWCPSAKLGDLLMLWGQDEWTASPTMAQTMRSLKDCRG